ncbi:MAG TPA: hypothetical protein VKT82_34570 [Ktedonobacterales bacterium]|nr:hypothetical protein [Ktedonobacterales bacterium]
MPEMPDDPSPIAEDDPVAERLPLTDLESRSASPPSPRKRLAQIALFVLAIVVASAVLWNSIGPGRHPTPQPSEPLIAISALLVSNVTNATVTLNGKKLTGPLPLVVSAYLQRDTVTISAPLFRPKTCQFQGLLTKTDTTHCLFTITSAPNGPPYVIGAFFTPDDLLPAQQNQIIAPIMQQVEQAQQLTAQPGDYIPTSFTIFGGFISSQRAAAPLQASATFVQGAAMAPSSFPSVSSCTQLICPVGFDQGNPKPAQPAWDIMLNIMLRWQFADSTGRVISNVTYPQSRTNGLVYFLPRIRFVYDATGWHLAAGIDLHAEVQSAFCETGFAILQQNLLNPSIGVISMEISSNKGVQGCLFTAQNSAGERSTFLWRFGVLLAADAGAHNLLPDLPMAPQDEKTSL